MHFSEPIYDVLYSSPRSNDGPVRHSQFFALFQLLEFRGTRLSSHILSLPHLDQGVTKCPTQSARKRHGHSISNLSELLFTVRMRQSPTSRVRWQRVSHHARWYSAACYPTGTSSCRGIPGREH